MVNQRYLIKRLGMMVLSLFAVITILFFLFRMTPGGPTAMMAPGALPEDQRQQILEQFGLTEPLWKQYLVFMENLVLHGDLGTSFYHGRPVTEVITDRLGNTLSLMLPAFILSYTLGFYIGSHLAWIRGSVAERAEMIVVLLVRSTPVFWTGLVLLYVFSFRLEWFPIGGMRGFGTSADGLALFLSTDFLWHVTLPIISLSLFYTGLPILLMRNNMLDVMTEGYIQTARAKGLGERRIMLWHAARNAALPVITAFAVVLGYSVGGQVLIEEVYSWPGLGKEMVDSAIRNDYPTAQGTFMMLSAMVIIMNFVADIVYTRLDPRVSVGER